MGPKTHGTHSCPGGKTLSGRGFGQAPGPGASRGSEWGLARSSGPLPGLEGSTLPRRLCYPANLAPPSQRPVRGSFLPRKLVSRGCLFLTVGLHVTRSVGVSQELLHMQSHRPPEEVKCSLVLGKQVVWSEIGIRNPWTCCLPGLQSSRSNPSIQATLNKTALSSSMNSHPQTSAPNASALQPSLRLFSLSNPSLPTTNLSVPARRRQPPVSPLTLSPGPEAHQGFSRQFSSTSPLNPYPASQVKITTMEQTEEFRDCSPSLSDFGLGTRHQVRDPQGRLPVRSECGAVADPGAHLPVRSECGAVADPGALTAS